MRLRPNITATRVQSPFTLFISGNDTGVGKTHVLGMIARALAKRGHQVELIKAIETGVGVHGTGDADRAAKVADNSNVSHRTLIRFSQPLAPLAAAKADRRSLTIKQLLRAMQNLPSTTCRLIEGAGGLAVPLDRDGRDWADFACAIRADITLLVVEDRLGTINQARLLAAYVSAKRIPNCFFVLNRIRPLGPALHLSNRDGLRAIGIRLFPSPDAVASFIARSLARPMTGKTAL